IAYEILWASIHAIMCTSLLYFLLGVSKLLVEPLEFLNFLHLHRTWDIEDLTPIEAFITATLVIAVDVHYIKHVSYAPLLVYLPCIHMKWLQNGHAHVFGLH
ncbi:hypothetical protein ACJX0J_016226, partial [Zea mays]